MTYLASLNPEEEDEEGYRARARCTIKNELALRKLVEATCVYLFIVLLIALLFSY